MFENQTSSCRRIFALVRHDYLPGRGFYEAARDAAQEPPSEGMMPVFNQGA